MQGAEAVPWARWKAKILSQETEDIVQVTSESGPREGGWLSGKNGLGGLPHSF
jgi:hypothetical protein